MQPPKASPASSPSSYDMAMHVPRRFLQGSGHTVAAPPPAPMELDSEVVVILAALLCALICVVGLALVARCAWLRRYSFGLPPPVTATADKGLSKNALLSLPKLSFRPEAEADEDTLADCPICLAEFAEGEEVRVLPQCGHRFHVACVDPWLRAHSSCPSCRQVLVAGGGAATRCQKCGARSGGLASPVAATAPAAAAQAGVGHGQG